MFVILLLTASAVLLVAIACVYRGFFPAARHVFLLGIVLNIAALIARGFVNGSWYFDQATTEAYLLPVFLAAIVVGYVRSGQYAVARVLCVALLVFVSIILATMSPGIVPVLRMRSIWAPLFFITEGLACAFFIAAGALALASFWMDNLKAALQSCAVWGFILFSLSQVVGAIWAYLGWSAPFAWNDRHLISTALWCLYAAILHARVAGIDIRIVRYCAIAGLVPTVYLCSFHGILDALMRLKAGQ